MRARLLVLFAVGLLSQFAAWASATTPTFFILQEDKRFLQTGPSTVTGDGFSFQGRASPNDGVGPIAYDGGTLTPPAASPLGAVPMGPVGVEVRYSSGKVDQTTFQTNFPGGIYTFHMTNSGNPALTQTEAVDSTIVTAPNTVGMLTASSFSGLQGMDSTKSFTVNFNTFADPNPTALIFFAVQDSLGNTPIFDGLQPNVTQDTIPANALQPGKQYNFFLFFDNIAITADNQGEVLLDNRTSGSFTTAPEPSTALPLIALGLAALAGRTRRTRTQCEVIA
jgi:hypothetical protein